MRSIKRNNLPVCKLSGIYIITNAETGKIYVGSATSIRGRLLSHRGSLRLGKHDNPHLQHSWNKYGEVSFVFDIIELCDIDNLLTREQYYIDRFQACNKLYGYNMAKIAGGSPMQGRNHSEESCKKMSDKRKGIIPTKATEAAAIANKGSHRSQEIKDKISKGNKGKKKSKEHRDALKANHWSKKMSKEEVSQRNSRASKAGHAKRSLETRLQLSGGTRLPKANTN